MSTFEIFPYDKDLDLTHMNDLKLCETARSGLKDGDRFDGYLDKANKFLKIFGKHVSYCRLKVLLEIAV